MSDGLIQAISRTVKTMADGTLRLTIDIEPMHAQDAFMLFGSPDVPMVLARLTQEAAQASMQKQAAEPKGGELAKWAGILCSDPLFFVWAAEYDLTLWTKCEKYALDMAKGNEEPDVEVAAAEFVRRCCGVSSRRDLDHFKHAGVAFREEIMRPFHQWKEKQ